MSDAPLAGTEGIRARLEAISEELADLALTRLREALEVGSGDAGARPRAVAEERRLTRARRAVDRAVAVLGSRGAGDA